MRVRMVFDFPGINDVDGETATEIVDVLTSISTQQADEFNALPPYKGFGKVSVWIDDVTEE